jgi:hypothetical protein
MLLGTAAMVLFTVARASFSGANAMTVCGLQHPQGASAGDPVAGGRVLKFVSRAEHLAWRERWRKGRSVKLSWTPEERSAILRQDEAYRQADASWERNHGPVPGGASILHWRHEPDVGMQGKEAP